MTRRPAVSDSARADNTTRLEFSRTKATALLCVIASTILIGSGNVAQITALESVGPFTATFLRAVVAIVALLPFAIRESNMICMPRPDVLLSMMAAAGYFAASMVAQQVGAMSTTATNIGFLINMSAIFTPMMIWMMIGQKPGLIVWPSSALAVLGAYFVTGAGTVSATWGDGLCLLAGAMDAVWIIAVGYTVVRYAAPAFITLLLFATTAIFGFAGSLTETVSLSAIQAALPEILWLGIMTSAAGFLLSTKAQVHLSSCTVAVIFCFEAIVSALCGRYFLGETLTIIGWTGAALVIGAIVLLQFGGKTGDSEPQNGPKREIRLNPLKPLKIT